MHINFQDPQFQYQTRNAKSGEARELVKLLRQVSSLESTASIQSGSNTLCFTERSTINERSQWTFKT